MATVYFFQRTTSKDKTKPVKIRVRFFQGKKFDLYGDTLKNIEPQKWDAKNEKLYDKDGLSEDEAKLQKTLRDLKNEILTSYENETDKTKIIVRWLNGIIDKFYNPEKYEIKKFTFYTFIEDFIKRSEDGKRKVGYRAIRRYHNTFKNLKEFAQIKDLEIEFQDIDLEFYEDFRLFLENKGLAVNTVGREIKTLKIFLNDATDRGVNTNLKFMSKKFIAPYEESESIYLNESELNYLYEYDLSKNEKYERVRDLFLVAAWTGLRFSDLSQVDERNIKEGFIHVTQSKTGGKIVIPIHHVVSEIYKKYDNKLPRAISNQKYNLYLRQMLTEYVDEMKKKGLEKKIGLNDIVFGKTIELGHKVAKRTQKYNLVTSHTARRSFASNMYRKGIQPITIMAITGHKTESAFLKYIRITPTEHAEKIRDIWTADSQHLKVVS